jgi:GxxExxY protein
LDQRRDNCRDADVEKKDKPRSGEEGPCPEKEMSKTTIYQDQELTHKILGAAIAVHRHVGPGLLESAYRFSLCLEFDSLNIRYQQELTVPLIYKGKKCDCGFRADFLVEDKIVLELKSIEALLSIHEAPLNLFTTDE